MHCLSLLAQPLPPCLPRALLISEPRIPDPAERVLLQAQLHLSGQNGTSINPSGKLASLAVSPSPTVTLHRAPPTLMGSILGSEFWTNPGRTVIWSPSQQHLLSAPVSSSHLQPLPSWSFCFPSLVPFRGCRFRLDLLHPGEYSGRPVLGPSWKGHKQLGLAGITEAQWRLRSGFSLLSLRPGPAG